MAELQILWVLYFSLLLTSSKVWSAQVDVDTFGDILHIDTACANDTSGRSVITVTSAQDAVVTIVCKNGYIAEPKPADKVHYIQEIAFSEADEQPCKFEKKNNSHVYTVLLYIAKLDKDHDVAISELRHDFILTCTYDEKGSSVTSKNDISFANLPFQEHVQEFGGKIQSNLSLILEDLQGSAAVSPIPLGRSVRLVARVTGDDFVRALTCSATNGLLNHTILVSGCGDGIVFPKEAGFTTKGKVIQSPFFPSFRLRGNPTLVFSCKFSSCGEGGCDGNSCSKTNILTSSRTWSPRSKRDAQDELMDVMYTVNTNRVMIEGNKKNPVVIHVDATEEKSVSFGGTATNYLHG